MKSAGFAVKHATYLARAAKLSEYIVGFLVVAFISVFPETFVSITSAIQGVPEFGLGTLFGSNVADLTIVVALVIFLASREIKIRSEVLKEAPPYLIVLVIPILLGLDGYYSRIEGIAFILTGVLFYFWLLQRNNSFSKREERGEHHNKFVARNSLFLILSLGVLLFSSYTTVKFGVNLANQLGINPILVGIIVVALGTTMPELLFSFKAEKAKHDALAVGDVLGTVITDATIIVGILALIKPFEFPARLVYITGIFMVLSAILLFYFMKSEKRLTKKEGLLLIIFYLVFVWVEFLANK